MAIIWSGGRPVVLDERMYSWYDGAGNGTAINYDQWLTDTGAGVDMSPDGVYRSQPAVRTVVSFLAKNVAQVPLHSFTIDAGGDRERDRDSPLARLMSKPSKKSTGFEWTHTLVTDCALWDRYAALVTDTGDGFELTRIPPRQWLFKRNGRDEPTGIVLADEQEWPLERLLWIDGYPTGAKSPMECIRDILVEEGESSAARRDMWKMRARIPGYLSRPADAPQWPPAARDNFRSSWQAYAAGGTRTGATPILEDGMTYTSGGMMTSVEADQIEARKLSRREIAAFYHVPPVMVGDSEASNYSNVVAYREQLYSDTLGHWFKMLSQAVNARVAPIVSPDGSKFVEFEVGEKLRLSFDQQADIYSKATGAPFMTRNEVRKLQNLPAQPGADQLILPINVAEPGTQ